MPNIFSAMQTIADYCKTATEKCIRVFDTDTGEILINSRPCYVRYSPYANYRIICVNKYDHATLISAKCP